MKLIIAEKPSLAKKIAEGLGGGRSQEGYIESGDYAIAFCFGHMIEMYMPEDYTEQWAWKNTGISDLPLCPDQWQQKERSDSGVKKQLKTIQNLLKKADLVINAGDPDREGQLLIDELIVEYNYTGPIQRLWAKDLTTKGIKSAFDSIQENQAYYALYLAGLGRQRADWLYGLNLTRAYTSLARDKGFNGVITMGRVQTPTLGLVVARDKAIADFVPIPFFDVMADFKTERGDYSGKWIVPETIANDNDQCIDKMVAENVKNEIMNSKSIIIEFSTDPVKMAVPLPFSLSKLQMLASKKWGYSAQEVLDTAQSLYETHSLILYPRTDCEYLNDNMYQDADSILSALTAIDGFSSMLDKADRNLKSRAFNDAKCTAHTGITPTAKTPDIASLNDKEKNVYTAIAKRYLAQFYPECLKEKTTVITEAASHQFKTTGTIITQNGWRDLYSNDDNDDQDEKEDGALPPITDKLTGTVSGATVNNKQTKPPLHFTEGTLIKAMVNIARFVDNPNIKKILRDNQGIGTEATRPAIIETLKTRGFLTLKKKNIIATDLGHQLIDSVPDIVSKPDITAFWEQKLEDIKTDEQLSKFLDSIVTWLTQHLSALSESSIAIESNALVVPCSHPLCDAKTTEQKGKNGAYFLCSSCGDAGRDKFIPAIRNKIAIIKKCPDSGCSGYAIQAYSKKSKSTYFSCSTCKDENRSFFYRDVKGQPEKASRDVSQERITASCPHPDCDGTATQFTKKKGGGKFWICNACETAKRKKFYDDKVGVPCV